MKVYLHIGWPKTGTSALQSHINTNRQWLETRGVSVPLAGYASAHGHAFLFSRHDTEEASPEMALFLKETGELNRLRDELLNCQQRGQRSALLSWEAFALSDAPLIGLLAEALAGFEIEVLAYLRNQSDLYQSLKIQSVETLPGTGRDLLQRDGSSTPSLPWFIDYHKVLSRWREQLPNHAVIRTRLYHRDLLKSRGVVTDFLEWVGVPVDASFCYLSNATNPSLDATSAMLLALIDSVGMNRRSRTRLSRALASACADVHAGPKGFLDSADSRRIQERYRTSNERLLAEFPPENLEGATPEGWFAAGNGLAAGDNANHPLVELYRTAYESLVSEEPVLWQGYILTGHDLHDLTIRVDDGWRATENIGVWSLGPVSWINFRLPRLNREGGPSRVLVSIEGRYFGDNNSTLVDIGGEAQRADLRDADIAVIIDDSVRRNGVRIRLAHDAPRSPAEAGTGPSTDPLAFLLTRLSYELDW